MISQFLSRVWGHVFLVMSDWCEFCLGLSVFLSFIHFSSCMQVFNSQSHVHAVLTAIAMYIRGFTMNIRICLGFFPFKGRLIVAG